MKFGVPPSTLVKIKSPLAQHNTTREGDDGNLWEEIPEKGTTICAEGQGDSTVATQNTSWEPSLISGLGFHIKTGKTSVIVKGFVQLEGETKSATRQLPGNA